MQARWGGAGQRSDPSGGAYGSTAASSSATDHAAWGPPLPAWGSPHPLRAAAVMQEVGGGGPETNLDASRPRTGGDDIRPTRLDLAGRQRGAGAAGPRGAAEPAPPKPVRPAPPCAQARTARGSDGARRPAASYGRRRQVGSPRGGRGPRGAGSPRSPAAPPPSPCRAGAQPLGRGREGCGAAGAGLGRGPGGLRSRGFVFREMPSIKSFLLLFLLMEGRVSARAGLRLS